MKNMTMGLCNRLYNEIGARRKQKVNNDDTESSYDYLYDIQNKSTTELSRFKAGGGDITQINDITGSSGDYRHNPLSISPSPHQTTP